MQRCLKSSFTPCQFSEATLLSSFQDLGSPQPWISDWVYSTIYEITPAEWASNHIIERLVALTIVMSLLQWLSQTTWLVNIVVSKLHRWVKQMEADGSLFSPSSLHSISQHCGKLAPREKTFSSDAAYVYSIFITVLSSSSGEQLRGRVRA